MVQIYQKTVADKTLRTLEKLKVGSWIYVENPTEDELENLSKQYRLELSLLSDALDPNEVPRVEVEDSTTYIFTRVPYGENDKIFTFPLLIAIGKDFLLTLTTRPLPFLNRFTTGKIDFFTTQKTRLFLQTFVEINSAYSLLLAGISKKIRSISVQLEKLDNKASFLLRNKDIIQFVNFEGVLNDFLAALIPTNASLQRLLSGKFLKLYEKDKDLTEDLLLDNGQLIEISKANLNTITNIREAYSTIMTNNLNRVIKLLTALTVILTVPTMIASIYGMNVPLPFANSPLVFVGIVVTVVFISAFLLVLFIKKQWI